MEERSRFIRNVILQALVIFLVLNLLFAALPVEKWLGEASLYNLELSRAMEASWAKRLSR